MPPTLNAADVRKMKVAELKVALTERGLDANGLKQDLINRLEAHLTQPTTAAAAASATDAPATALATRAEAAQQQEVSSHATVTESVQPAPTAITASTSVVTPVTTTTATSAAAPIVVAGVTDPEIEAKRKRAEKFGTSLNITDDEKKRLREQRFGTTTITTTASTTMSEGSASKKQKTESSGPLPGGKGYSSPLSTDPAEFEKMRARAAKFGLPVPTEPVASTTASAAKTGAVSNAQSKQVKDGKLDASAAAEVDSAEEKKRKARAARFAAPAAK